MKILRLHRWFVKPPRILKMKYAAGTFHAVQVGQLCPCGRGWVMACHSDGTRHSDPRIDVCQRRSGRITYHWAKATPTAAALAVTGS